MRRRAPRRYDPIVPKIQRVELDEGHLLVRIIALVAAVGLAVGAFVYLISTLLTPQTGWQAVDPTNSMTGCASQFLMSYDIGSSGSASAEYKQVSLCFTETADSAYLALSNVPCNQVLNLYLLNQFPNQKLTVDPMLYRALETIQASGSRIIYFAPLFSQYQSVYLCEIDSDAEKFDPYLSEDVMEYVREVAAFAASPDCVQVNLLGDCQVELFVSDAYLAYAEENEIDAFVDFGWLKNAFIIDEVSEALISRGLTKGSISSFDGFSRVMGEEAYSVNLFGRPEGEPVMLATINYTGPKSIVSFRAFPAIEKDAQNYYSYASGVVRGPYIAADGLFKSAAENLTVFSQNQSCAALAIAALNVFAADTLDEGHLPVGISWVRSSGNQILVSGSGLQLSDLRNGFTAVSK